MLVTASLLSIQSFLTASSPPIHSRESYSKMPPSVVIPPKDIIECHSPCSLEDFLLQLWPQPWWIPSSQLHLLIIWSLKCPYFLKSLLSTFEMKTFCLAFCLFVCFEKESNHVPLAGLEIVYQAVLEVWDLPASIFILLRLRLCAIASSHLLVKNITILYTNIYCFLLPF